MRGPKGPTGPTRSIYDWNCQSSPATTADRWTRRGQGAFVGAVCCQVLVGQATTLTSMSVKIYGTALSTDSVTFTLQKNGVDTALTATVAAGGTSASGSGSIAIAKGDYLTVKANGSGTEAQANWWVYGSVSD